jgi:hypothetical protein
MKLRMVFGAALLATLCAGAASVSGQTFSIPGFSMPSSSGESEGSQSVATVIIRCGTSGGGTPATGTGGLVAEGSCSCAESGSGAVACGCDSATTAPTSGGSSDWSFETSSGFPSAAREDLTQSGSCVDAKARMESRADGTRGCVTTTAGSTASLLFVCDIPGEPVVGQ